MHSAVPKVLCYVIWRGQLLLLKQPDRPDRGVQVPGGSVEAGEDLTTAALREAREETGLSALSVLGCLGSAIYELKVDVGPPHLRHFFQLRCDEPPSNRWQHLEPATLSRPVAQRFELWWEPLESARIDWEMDRFLDVLRSAL
jgi:8-oxo-dGTP pyrophosphatase MutT (NUDIX family)